ncbi:subtype I-B CRISPR-associated endonuclease Cas1 [Candidatus Aerophobetes bacterium]|uniref:CRISPR-associated endonuclease Cas1 n=1 Tax=Aerophobetes bacterium TaxID=2030807 RepID=A0A662DBR5_UNCAE|nr:MAG: subtype I-B CRISPR-associated endonuclease Cas1 [Candidatus Aerophobetes bacterium]
MKRTIYIFSNGELKRKQNTIYFEREKGGKKYVPVENTGEIMIFGEVTINKKLLDFLSQQEIILHFFNYYGYYSGSFYPREHYNSGYMTLKQCEHYLDEGKRMDLAQRFVKGAVANIKKVLSYYHNRGIDLASNIEQIESLEEEISFQQSTDALMAIEGNIRDFYYKAFNKIINNSEFEFGERSRRPPQNRLNALISFGNSLVYTAILSEIYKTHLDPRIGFLHTTNFRRFTLNLDVAEIFKPVIADRIIFYLVNKGVIKTNHFVKALGGVSLNEKGRMIFVEAFDKRLKTVIQHSSIRKRVSYKRLMRLELYKLEKHFMGERPYLPFVAYW